MEVLIIIVLLIIVWYILSKKDKQEECKEKKFHMYIPPTLDKFSNEKFEEKPIEKTTSEETAEKPIIDFSKEIEQIDQNNDVVYNMFINKELDNNLSEDRIFKGKLLYDYRNMDSIEKAVHYNNYHHFAQRYTK